MKKSKFKIQNFKCFFCILLSAFCFVSVKAQSTNLDFPTAVSTSEISGTIPARDIGDSRLTSFYYTFNGIQGDIFINISSSNFNGDIEVFVAEGLRSLSKISMYADNPVSETGRVIYLRKPERLILRVQGRSPDDNPARYTIKFAGSFVAVQKSGEAEELVLPEIKTAESGSIRVNSVGTIIEVKPEPTPVSKETIAETNQSETAEESRDLNKNDDTRKNEEADNVSEKTESADAPESVAKKPAQRASRRNSARSANSRTRTPPKTVEPKETPPNPLENVHLKVSMKTGEELDFPMTEIFRFAMNNGVLTITMKNGKIHRYPISDTQRIVIE